MRNNKLILKKYANPKSLFSYNKEQLNKILKLLFIIALGNKTTYWDNLLISLSSDYSKNIAANLPVFQFK